MSEEPSVLSKLAAQLKAECTGFDGTAGRDRHHPRKGLASNCSNGNKKDQVGR